MAKKNQLWDAIGEGVNAFIDARANHAKLKTALEINDAKMKQNWFYKMQEEKQKQEMEWQNRRRELDYIKEQFGGGQTGQPQTDAYFGMGVNPIGKQPVDPYTSPYSTGGINTPGQTSQGQPNTNPITANQALENLARQRGFEITGYDPKGRPIIRKIKRDINAEKFDFQQEQAREQKNETVNALIESAQQTKSTIQEIKSGLKYFGAMGDVPPWPAEYSKKNWLANINRLKDKLVVDLMLKMKAASKTGSTGFGQLSEREGLRLENAATALNKGLKEEDALKYLNEIENAANKILSKGSGKKQLDQETAMQFLQQANGDKNKARQLAQEAGFEF